MYTEYKAKGKVFQFNTKAALAMGKDAFMAAHHNVPDRDKAWELIAKAGKKEEKPEKTKPEKPEKTK